MNPPLVINKIEETKISQSMMKLMSKHSVIMHNHKSAINENAFEYM